MRSKTADQSISGLITAAISLKPQPVSPDPAHNLGPVLRAAVLGWGRGSRKPRTAPAVKIPAPDVDDGISGRAEDDGTIASAGSGHHIFSTGDQWVPLLNDFSK